VILLAIVLQASPAPIIDWQPFPIQRTPDGGLYDRTSATRNGDIVSTWVRFVNMELKGVNKSGEQTDSHLVVDCRKPRMKMLAVRVVRPDGTILKSVVNGPSELGWREMRIGMRGWDIRAGLCSRVR